MLERFGRLCGWTGTGIAILLIGAAVLLPVAAEPPPDYIFSRVLFLVIPGVVAFLLGQAIRFVLVPPKKEDATAMSKWGWEDYLGLLNIVLYCVVVAWFIEVLSPVIVTAFGRLGPFLCENRWILC
jgi:hypothetical protein